MVFLIALLVYLNFLLGNVTVYVVIKDKFDINLVLWYGVPGIYSVERDVVVIGFWEVINPSNMHIVR